MKNLSPINDDKDVVTKEYVDPVKSQAAINRTTLGIKRRNLLPYPKSIVKGGITFTCDENGYMTGSNTTSDTRLWTSANAQYSMYLEAGTYYFSSFAETVCTNSFGMAYIIANGKGIVGLDIRETHEEKSFTLSEATTIYVMAKVYDGKVAFMIREADITDDTYEPYKESVDERLIENKSNAAVNRSTLGYQCKNLLKNNVVTQTVSGVTFTINDDKSITVNGTATAQISFGINNKVGLGIGNYILTGCPSGGSNNTFYLTAYASSAWLSAPDFGSGCKIENKTVTHIVITIASGYTANNLKFYPMLRYADIIDDTYEPYKPSLIDRCLLKDTAGIALGVAQKGGITIDNLSSYTALWLYVVGNVSGINFATNLIVPVAYLAKSTSNSVKLAGGIPSSAYITSEGPLAAKNMDGTVTAKVSGNKLDLTISDGIIGSVEVISLI